MQIISSLILVVGALVAVSTTVAALDESKTLITGLTMSDTLTRDQLLNKLNEVRADNFKAKSVAADLYATSEKASTEVVVGITVDELVRQAKFEWSKDCTKTALKQRAELIAGLEPKNMQGTSYAVKAYLSACLRRAADHCMIHKKQVIEGGINKDEEWLDALSETVRYDDYEFELSKLSPEIVDFLQRE